MSAQVSGECPIRRPACAEPAQTWSIAHNSCVLPPSARASPWTTGPRCARPLPCPRNLRSACRRTFLWKTGFVWPPNPCCLLSYRRFPAQHAPRQADQPAAAQQMRTCAHPAASARCITARHAAPKLRHQARTLCHKRGLSGLVLRHLEDLVRLADRRLAESAQRLRCVHLRTRAPDDSGEWRCSPRQSRTRLRRNRDGPGRRATARSRSRMASCRQRRSSAKDRPDAWAIPLHKGSRRERAGCPAVPTMVATRTCRQNKR